MADLPGKRSLTVNGEEWPSLVRDIRSRTPARILEGRAGAAYRTGTQLALREAHAAARDAVRDELDLNAAFGVEFVERWELHEFHTRARTKDEYLLRPDLGRQFDDESRAHLVANRTRGSDLQIAIGDGLSVAAVAEQVPPLLPLLFDGAKARGWSLGRPFVIRHCRVGILNDIGEMLAPQVAVLLIGERPGLATATSLSAYMAFRPAKSHTDADRNLISNIHARGVGAAEAAQRILNLASQMMAAGTSGCGLREDLRRLA
ncbi:MAG TPA: ethanolamine ammonia-lyase subunit EutC [Verrucomicrobiae bacterium]|nr:ethanolamine ammonia-lyase subunit EutC [Verrucomicrobiae bacterium]